VRRTTELGGRVRDWRRVALVVATVVEVGARPRYSVVRVKFPGVTRWKVMGTVSVWRLWGS
jgi:hypothetical protein